MPRLNFPFVCGLDWLQIYVFLHNEIADLENSSIKVKVEDFPTPQFLRRARIFLAYDKLFLPFCQLLFVPRTSVLPRNAAQVKIENRALYESALMPRISFVFSALDIEYRSLSRVDVYFDCNKFYGGKSPRAIVNDYTRQKILKIGINKGYLNFANYGYLVANGSTKMPAGFKVGTPQWTGITWGSKDYVQTQIYDKTRELREVKYKPWIVESWQNAGLDINNVWRTEMRIMHHGKGIKLLDSGDLFALGAFEVANDERIRELFRTFAERHLRFVYKDYHAKRQQMRPVRLFEHLMQQEPTIKPKVIVSKSHSNRTTNLVANFLITLKEYTDNNAIVPTSRAIGVQIDNVINQIKATFPNYFFKEKNVSEVEVFRRLNDSLLRRKNIAGMPIDLFVQGFLEDMQKG